MTVTPPAGQPDTPAELASELTRELPRLKKQFDRMLAGVASRLADQNPDDVLARVFHGMLAEPDQETVAAAAAMAVLALARQRADELDAAPAAPAPKPAVQHEATAYWDGRSGSYGWKCSCGEKTRPVFPLPAAESAARSHEQDAARATDPGPAAPTTYQLPAEVTELHQLRATIDRVRALADSIAAESPKPGPGGFIAEGIYDALGPLSTVPPAGTETQ